MSRIHVEAERIVDATPDAVYQLLADYRAGRPRILPPNYLDYTVEQGGQGAGTVVRYRFRAANRERPYQMRVAEPARGNVLTESDTSSSLVTTWTLVPAEGGAKTRVRLTTEWDGAAGIGGFFEKTFAPGGLRRIYDDMLTRLERTLTGAETAA